MPPPPGSPEPMPAVAGVEQRREPRLRDHLVERIGQPVVREELLHVGVELEALDAVVVDQARASLDPSPAPVRVDARERDQHVGVGGATSAISSFGTRRLPGDRLRIHGEDDGHHPPLAVVRRQLERSRPRGLAAEVPDCGVAQLVGKGVPSRVRHLDVGMEVDRDGVVEGEALAVSHGYRLSLGTARHWSSCAAASVAPAYAPRRRLGSWSS